MMSSGTAVASEVMTGWMEFAAAIAVFFLSHSLPLRPAVRARGVEYLGRGGFGLLYSALSIAALAWMIGAAGRAPFVHEEQVARSDTSSCTVVLGRNYRS